VVARIQNTAAVAERLWRAKESRSQNNNLLISPDFFILSFWILTFYSELVENPEHIEGSKGWLLNS
jgi:hypothetical protein